MRIVEVVVRRQEEEAEEELDRKVHPKSIDLATIMMLWQEEEEDNEDLPTTRFREFPFGRRSINVTMLSGGGGTIKNLDSDYGTLIYHSIQNHDIFARIIQQQQQHGGEDRERAQQWDDCDGCF